MSKINNTKLIFKLLILSILGFLLFLSVTQIVFQFYPIPKKDISWGIAVCYYYKLFLINIFFLMLSWIFKRKIIISIINLLSVLLIFFMFFPTFHTYPIRAVFLWI